MDADLKALLLGLFLFFSLSNFLSAWDKDEHRLISDEALSLVLTQIGEELDEDLLILFSEHGFSFRTGKTTFRKKTFGEICAWASGDDMAYSRFQERGKTILQQLTPLSASILYSIWTSHNDHKSKDRWDEDDLRPDIQSAQLPGYNVVVNYFVHHWLALRFAQIAGSDRTNTKAALMRALIYEAMAQSYLSDSFCSGHLLIPLQDRFFRLHPKNNREAHDFYNNEGVYVINSCGDVWQTYGHGLLKWYSPTYRHVLEACVTSLQELFLLYFVSGGMDLMPQKLEEWALNAADRTSIREMARQWIGVLNGVEYYSKIRMPVLLLLPMPVSATWSIRTEKMDKNGIHLRRHFPQLKENGFHTPDLAGIDKEFLYSRQAIPDWFFSDLLLKKNPAELIKSHPDIASVRFVQERNFLPSYKGVLVHMGGGAGSSANGVVSAGLFGLGYGFFSDLVFIKNLSIEAALIPWDRRFNRLLLSPMLGFSLPLPAPFHLWQAYHFEIGYGWDLRSPSQGSGFQFSAGIEFPTLSLDFTYLGATVRLMYKSVALEQKWNGVFLEIVFQ